MNLAIKAHKTRGKEVIAILEMLGGQNVYNLTGDKTMAYYLVENKEIKGSFAIFGDEPYILLTLEEFLEKYPYKIGDRARIPDYESEVRIDDMHWDGHEIRYNIFSDESEWYSAVELNRFNEPYKEQETPIDFIQESDVDEGEYDAVRRKLQYPKTYEECCDILQLEHTFELKDLTIDEEKLTDSFIRLKRCRDAYWKIIGEQMGLGKPWQPDWTNSTEIKYCITTVGHNVEYFESRTINIFLAFPTEEILDDFDKNFDNLMVTCKELL